MFDKHDISRNACMLKGRQARCGYDWWWHSFTGYHSVTGEAKAFFVEFFLCNPAFGGEEPVFGQLPENQAAGKKPSYLMVKAGAWGEDAAQLHCFYGWKKIKVDWGIPFSIRAEQVFLSETETFGTVQVTPEESRIHPEYMSDAGNMSWNLNIRKKIPFNVGYGAGRFFRTLQAFEMFWHAEGMKTEYEGSVTWNGETYLVKPETCYGYADKNWGKGFTSPWVWLSSCNLTSRITGRKLTESVFDIGGGNPKAGPIVFPNQLLTAIRYEGKNYEFNFSKFWTGARTKFDCRETDTQILWHIEQRNWTQRMVADFTCEKKDMLLVNYEAPNGEKRHNRLWNGGNGKGTILLYEHGKLVDEIAAENTGCEYGEFDAMHSN